MPTHPKTSRKDSEGETCKLLRPSEEVQKKMHPVNRDAFDGLLRRAATPPSPKRAAKHR